MIIERQIDERRRQLQGRELELRLLAGVIARSGLGGSRQLADYADGLTLLRPADGQPAGPVLRPVSLSALKQAFRPVG